MVDTEILWWADASVAAPVWNPLAPGHRQARRPRPRRWVRRHGGPGWIGLSVAEVSNGTDLNGDGDQADQVYVLVDLSAQPARRPQHRHRAARACRRFRSRARRSPITGVGGDTGVVIQAAETRQR